MPDNPTLTCRCGRLFATWQGRVNHGRHKSACRLSPSERLWSRITERNGCWEWDGARIGAGYGLILVDDKLVGAHRLAWELLYGPIPDGLDVLHHCDNPPCLRPLHLWLGTPVDNALDMVAKGRQGSATHPEKFRGRVAA